MSAGLSASYQNIPEMRFDSYFDKDGGDHRSISDHPFIILSADNSNQIRTLRNELIKLNIHFVDFTNTMTVGTYAEQKRKEPKIHLKQSWNILVYVLLEIKKH